MFVEANAQSINVIATLPFSLIFTRQLINLAIC